MTREQWLQNAAAELRPMLATASGFEVPTVRIGVGWPSSGIRSAAEGQCWKTSVSGDGIAEITVRVSVTDPIRVLSILLHELIHAALDCEGGHGGEFKQAWRAVGFTGRAKGSKPGDTLAAELGRIAERLGAYPAAEFNAAVGEVKRQTTRMLKAECAVCGFVFRTARQWIDQAADGLRCPDVLCDGSAVAA